MFRHLTSQIFFTYKNISVFWSELIISTSSSTYCCIGQTEHQSLLCYKKRHVVLRKAIPYYSCYDPALRRILECVKYTIDNGKCIKAK